MHGGFVGVMCCPSCIRGILLVLYVAPVLHGGFLLVLYVAPVVRGGFCWCYMLPQLCLGLSVRFICCPSCAWEFL